MPRSPGAQAEALAGAFGEEVIVDHAMRYGRPAIAERIDALMAQGCDRILLAPLYPQYCAATTATANDAAFAHLADPALPAGDPDPAALFRRPGLYRRAEGVGRGRRWPALDFAPQAILASFHGMPERTRTLGDPYHDHCQATARLLPRRSGETIEVTFQSRFGRAKWLEPATDARLAALPGEGVTELAVISPGFSADCLETLEELAIRGRDTFLAAGGRTFAYLPCLNDNAPGMTMLRTLIGRELEGWLPAQ